MNILIVIPSFNTQSQINILIDEILSYSKFNILIVDDGSYTPLKIPINKSIKLIRNSKNMGKGYAIKEALKHAMLNGYSHILTIDSDLQHDPNKINEFVEVNKNIDLVIGKRNFSKPMPIHRQISNKLTSKLISAIISNKIYDSQSGYRRYNLKLFNKKTFKENGFHFESEILLKCVNSKTKIKHIDIPTIYNGSKSAIKNFSDTRKFISLIWRHCIAR